MKTLLTVIITFIVCSFTFGQKKTEVADLTIKVGAKKEEIVYYAFEKGDIILFSFTEIDGKKLNELEIVEYPNNTKFQDFKVEKIENKEITVNQRAIYSFRFNNSSAFEKRICKIHIERISPNNSNDNFNTGVKWINKYDTSYSIKEENVIVDYKNINKRRSKRVLISVDTNIRTIIDRVERVHSSTNMNGSNVSYLETQLPANSYIPNKFLPYESTEVQSWVYSISVGNTGESWYKNANSKALAKSSTELGINYGIISSGYGAMALLALEGISVFANPPQGNNVKFRIFTNINGSTITLAYGNSVTAIERIDKYKQGGFSLELLNDNVLNGINVTVKVIAVTLTKVWKDEYYNIVVREPIKDKKNT